MTKEIPPEILTTLPVEISALVRNGKISLFEAAHMVTRKAFDADLRHLIDTGDMGVETAFKHHLARRLDDIYVALIENS